MSPTSHCRCNAFQENRRTFLDARNLSCHQAVPTNGSDGDGAPDTGALKGSCWVCQKTRALPLRTSGLPLCKKRHAGVKARDRQLRRRAEHRGENCKVVLAELSFCSDDSKAKAEARKQTRHEVMSSTIQEHVTEGDLLLTRAGVRRLKKDESNCDSDDTNGKFNAFHVQEDGQAWQADGTVPESQRTDQKIQMRRPPNTRRRGRPVSLLAAVLPALHMGSAGQPSPQRFTCT